MEKYLIKIRTILRKRGIIIDRATLKEHQSQGLMSKVFVVDSNKGKLILHFGKMTVEQRRQKVWQKIKAVGELLKAYPKIPTAEVFASGSFADKYFIVQTKLRGAPAGKRTILKNKRVTDVWRVSRREFEPQIIKLLARINRIKMTGAGWLVVKDGKIQGRYNNWNEFLEREMRLWIRGIAAREKSPVLGQRLADYYQRQKSAIKFKGSFLIHNDLVNPSNILVRNGSVSGLVDWEWALAGDPAWEFAFNNMYDLKKYFRISTPKYSLPDQKEFKKRVEIYGFLFLIWGLYVHAQDTDRRVYQALKKHLLASLV